MHSTQKMESRNLFNQQLYPATDRESLSVMWEVPLLAPRRRRRGTLRLFITPEWQTASGAASEV